MKKILSALTLSLLATTAFADDLEIADVTEGIIPSGQAEATLLVKGNILQTTCVLSGASTDKTVTLKKAGNQDATVYDLRVFNSTAAKTPFTIEFANCPPSYTDASGNVFNTVFVNFDGSSSNVNEAGKLINISKDAKAAQNVTVELLNNKEEVINLKNNEQSTSAPLGYSDIHVLNFSAQFKASGTAHVTAGEFVSSVPFKVDYK